MISKLHQMLPPKRSEIVAPEREVKEVILAVRPLAERHQQRHRAFRRRHRLRQLLQRRRFARAARSHQPDRFRKRRHPPQAFERYFFSRRAPQPQPQRDRTRRVFPLRPECRNVRLGGSTQPRRHRVHRIRARQIKPAQELLIAGVGLRGRLDRTQRAPACNRLDRRLLRRRLPLAQQRRGIARLVGIDELGAGLAKPDTVRSAAALGGRHVLVIALASWRRRCDVRANSDIDCLVGINRRPGGRPHTSRVRAVVARARCQKTNGLGREIVAHENLRSSVEHTWGVLASRNRRQNTTLAAIGARPGQVPLKDLQAVFLSPSTGLIESLLAG